MKTTNYNIVLIGAGNVATQLGLALKKAGLNIIQVYSKHKSSSEKLAKQLKCEHSNSPDKLNRTADIYIVAVNDDVIAEVAKQVNLSNKIVVHTSGSVEMDVLKPASNNIGVFYPLQTFSKTKNIDFKNIPICLEANNTKTYKTIELIAKLISNNVKKINSEQRINIHIAAVFACNFTNHFYSIANDILQANKLSLDIIKPLIAETAEKIKNNPPAKMQTGPAIRGDKKTMDKHLKILTDKEHIRLYQLISKSIIGEFQKKQT